MKSIWVKICDYIRDHWLIGLGIFCFGAAFGVLIFPILSDAVFNQLDIGLAGVMVALGANLLMLSKNNTEKKEQHSRYYLDSCILAYENASEILKDGNDDAVNWIRAAYMLLHARELAKEVKGSHCNILEVHKRKYEGVFSNILVKKDRHNFWNMSILQDHLFYVDKIYEQCRKVPPSHPAKKKHVPPVPAHAIRVVCLAARWIDDSGSSCPLEEQKFSDAEKKRIGFTP